jgi:hypothetical protein
MRKINSLRFIIGVICLSLASLILISDNVGAASIYYTDESGMAQANAQSPSNGRCIGFNTTLNNTNYYLVNVTYSASCTAPNVSIVTSSFEEILAVGHYTSGTNIALNGSMPLTNNTNYWACFFNEKESGSYNANFGIAGDMPKTGDTNLIRYRCRDYSRDLVCDDFISQCIVGFKLVYSPAETPAQPTDQSIVDIITKNTTGTIKSLFGEGEDFYVFLNYTNSSNFTHTTGNCNINITPVVVEKETEDRSYTICSICANTTIHFNETYLTTNVISDYPHFRACHVDNPLSEIYAIVYCDGGATSRTITKSEIPICPNKAAFFINTTACISKKTISLNISTDATNPTKAVNISDVDFDREFSWINYTAFYNSTTTLYDISETFEYYMHDSVSLTARCNITNKFNATKTESVTIINIAPYVDLIGYSVNDVFYNLTNNTKIEFQNGTYFFLISIVDNDLTNYSIVIGNSSGIISTFKNFSLAYVDSSYFRDFEANPFYINITANDTSGNYTRKTYFFNNTDTIYPLASGFANFSRTNGSLYNWNLTFMDESIFGFNLTCDTGWNRSVTGISGVDTYIWDNESMQITKNTTCTIIYCDGHTSNSLKQKWNVEYESGKVKTRNTRQQIEFWADNMMLDSYTAKKDRISYKLSFNDSVSEKKLYYKGVGQSYFIESSKYKGWMVNYPESKTWFDVNGFKGSVAAYSEDGITWELTLRDSKDKIKGFQMESIGELNCKTESIFIESLVPKDTHTSLNALQCPKDTESVFIFGIIVALLFVMLGMNMVYFRIPMFNIIIGISFIVISLVLFGCHWVIGTAMMAFGIIVTLSAVL